MGPKHCCDPVLVSPMGGSNAKRVDRCSGHHIHSLSILHLRGGEEEHALPVQSVFN